MTNGSSQGLFVVVAVVIFGIFVAISYTLFRDQLTPSLASIFGDSLEQTSEKLDGNYVYFADKLLEQAIQTKLISDGTIKEGDKITKESLLKLEKFEFNGSSLPLGERVKSIEGLQYAKNINNLYLGHHQIEDISYLQDLKNLKHLTLGKSTIKNEDLRYLRKLTKLQTLNVGTCGLSDVSELRHLKGLITLSIDTNPITDVSFINELPNLTNLHLYSTKVKDVTPLLQHPKLSYLDARYNIFEQEDLLQVIKKIETVILKLA